MAGKSWQPSHESPHSKRYRHPSHCRNSGKRVGNFKGVGGELPVRWAATLQKMPENTCMYTMLWSMSTWNSDTCFIYVSTPLTTRGTQALFVMNSVKLHLTACIYVLLWPLVISAFGICRYADNMEGLFKSLALQHMPTNMQNIDRKKSGKLVAS